MEEEGTPKRLLERKQQGARKRPKKVLSFSLFPLPRLVFTIWLALLLGDISRKASGVHRVRTYIYTQAGTKELSTIETGAWNSRREIQQESLPFPVVVYIELATFCS